MRRTLAVLLGLWFTALALWMIAAPMNWYNRVGATTGPANVHFIRDLGCAFLVSALSLFWFAKSPRTWPAAVAGVSFLVLHVLVHLWDTAAGREPYHLFVLELPTVFLPALLGIWVIWPQSKR